MFGRHYQQLNEQRCPVNLPRETLNNISLTRGFPQYLFPFPRVTLTFCSLNRGISRGKPRQNRGKISMQVFNVHSTMFQLLGPQTIYQVSATWTPLGDFRLPDPLFCIVIVCSIII